MNISLLKMLVLALIVSQLNLLTITVKSETISEEASLQYNDFMEKYNEALELIESATVDELTKTIDSETNKYENVEIEGQIEQNDDELVEIQNSLIVVEEKVSEENNLENTELITIGSEILGELDSNKSERYYKFILDKPGNLEIKVESNEDIRFELVLDMSESELNVNDRTLLSGFIYSDRTYTQNIELGPGVYFFEVSSRTSSVSAIYSLNLNFSEFAYNEVEKNNELSHAQSIEVNSVINGYMFDNDLTDYFVIHVDKPGYLSIQIEGDTNSNISRRPYFDYQLKIEGDKDSQTLYGRIYSDGNEEENTVINRVVNAGTYYLKLNTSFGERSIYKIKTNYTEIENNEIEPNNTRTEAQLIQPNDLVKGFIWHNDKTDYYRIQLNEPGILEIEIESFVDPDVRYEIYLWDSNSNSYITTLKQGSIETEGGESNILTFKQDVGPGTYYISISDYYLKSDSYRYSGEYTLKTKFNTDIIYNEIEPNNTREFAQLVSNGSEVYGYLDFDNDRTDYFKIEVDKLCRLEILFESNKGALGGEIYYSNNESTPIKTFEFYPSSPDVTKQLVGPGTYFIQLSPYWEQNVEYNFKVKVTELTNEEFNYNEKEPNNSYEQAQILSVSSTINGLIWHEDNLDIFEIMTPRTGELLLEISSDVPILKYEIMDNYFNIVSSGIIQSNQQLVKINLNLEKGQYYLNISGSDLTGGTYRITASMPFSDVEEGKWYTSHIQEFASLGYINGYGDGTFKPQNSITRAEFVKIVNKAFGLADKYTPVTSLPFTDLDSQWKKDELRLALAAGYITPATEFRHNAPINRQEAAKIIGYLLGDKLTNHSNWEFVDSDEIATWAQDYVAGLVEAQVLSKNESFRPKDPITRAEAVKMLNIARGL